MNKKGIELSINFLVILIISIVVFVGGLSLVNKIFFQAEKLHSTLSQEAIKDIEKLMSNGEKLALPKNKISIRKGDDYLFGLGIYNIIKSPPETEFTIKVNCVKALDLDGNELDNNEYNCEYIDKNWHTYGCDASDTTCSQITKKIKNNNREVVSILMKAGLTSGEGVSTPYGIYIFNVEVTYPNPDPTLPDLTYDKIKKIYLEVD